jgi:hypothetical protein
MDKQTLKYYAEYRAKNRKKLRDYNRGYNKDYRKEHGYSNERKWDKENPEKRAAHAKVAAAVASGKLKKPSGGVVAHHSNYKQPLNVRWISKSKNRQLAEK